MSNALYILRRNYLIVKIAASMTPVRMMPLIARHAFSRMVLKKYYPGYAILGLTNRCSCNCQHCYAYFYRLTDTENEMTTSQWMGALDQVRALKIPRVHFSGGECTLREDLPDLVQYSRKIGLVSILETNGLLLGNRLVKELKAAGICGIVVSLDSSDRSRHDGIRKFDGCFDSAVAGMHRCVEHRIPCVISTFANREKLEDSDLENLMKLGKRIGVQGIRLIPPVESGRCADQKDIKLTAGDAERIEQALDSSIAYFRGMYYGAGCAAVEKGTLYINPSGEVQPCAVVPFSFGSIQKKALPAILNRMWDHPICQFETVGCLMNDEKYRKMFRKDIDQGPSPVRISSEEE